VNTVSVAGMPSWTIPLLSALGPSVQGDVSADTSPCADAADALIAGFCTCTTGTPTSARPGCQGVNASPGSLAWMHASQQANKNPRLDSAGGLGIPGATGRKSPRRRRRVGGALRCRTNASGPLASRKAGSRVVLARAVRSEEMPALPCQRLALCCYRRLPGIYHPLSGRGAVERRGCPCAWSVEATDWSVPTAGPSAVLDLARPEGSGDDDDPGSRGLSRRSGAGISSAAGSSM